MGLTYGLTSAREVFEKLQRDGDRLEAEFTSDGLFNFVLTGYSLIDWVKCDPSLPRSAQSREEIKSLYDDFWLKVCGDLATASKHFNLSKRQPITRSATNSVGYGVGRFGKGGFGAGEEAVHIELNDGTTYGGLEFVDGVLESWTNFFERHQI